MLFPHSCRIALNKLEVLSGITFEHIFFEGALQWFMCWECLCQMMITKKITTGIYSNIAFLSNWQKKPAKIEPISNEYLGVSMLFLVTTNTSEVASISQEAKSIDQSVLGALFIL